MKRLVCAALAAFLCVLWQIPASAEEAQKPAVEEIVVTGSYIKGSAEDAALPVDVITQQDLQKQGDPSMVEMIRNLGVASGNIAEENQFQVPAQGNSAVTTINLRGLGATRTLVLVNGRRHVVTENTGVDVSFMPQAALGRTEVLKDGAAALYGSDAIAGVVNLITRGDFEGLEVYGSNQWLDNSKGTQDGSIIWGGGNDRLHGMVAAEYEQRDNLKVRDRDWALLPRPLNPAGGWSSIANPATLYPANFTPINGALNQADVGCALLGGAVNGVTPAGSSNCAFQYTFFDNLINKTKSGRYWGEASYELTDASTLHFEGLFAKVETRVYTSPSYAPQSLFGPDRVIAPTHPGLIQYRLDNPTTVVGQGTGGVFALARAFGVTGWFGDTQKGDATTDTYRLSTSLVGDFDEKIHYDFAVSYSNRERNSETPDTEVEKMAFALDGLGGPNCVPGPTAVPGAGGCEYYNPFSNAIQYSRINGAFNPQFKPNLANSAELSQWLIAWQTYDLTSQLLVFDGVISGETPFELPGGTIGWALGAQARTEKFDAKLNDIANRQVNPCPFNNPYSVTLGNISQANFDACQNGLDPDPTGLLGFLSAYDETSTKRTIYAAFSELAIPVTDSIDMQAAVRFEDYGGEVGSTVDPKLAIRWKALDWLTLRGSASTTFRGPPLTTLSGRTTTLQFIAPVNAFKAVDIVGNNNLQAETATSTNVGFVVELGGFTGSVDYWYYKFQKPLQVESQGQLVNKYTALGCQGPPGAAVAGAGYNSPQCRELYNHIFPLATAPAGITRVDTYWINGSDIDTSGYDVSLQYVFDNVFGGALTIGTEGTYTDQYKSDDFLDLGGVILAPGGDFAGFYNVKTNPFTPIPQLKGNAFVRYSHDALNLGLTARYVDNEKDAAPSVAYLGKIDSMTTYDFTAIYQWRDVTIAASVFNLTDEDPPRVSADLNYDAWSVSAFGRMAKLGITYTMGGK